MKNNGNKNSKTWMIKNDEVEGISKKMENW
jgi:hypothetical protein